VFNFLGEVMNERIEKLAEQAGFFEAWFSESGDDCERELKEFAALVEAAARADEREACEKLCMAVPRTGAYFARLIRARGTT
jgi:hypothetical protein